MLHIGPHKTGTTTIQGALHNSRDALLEQGVRYAGQWQQAYWAARTIVGNPGAPGRRKPDPKIWRRLVKEVTTSSQGRVIVSSEAFAGADDATAARIVADLGASRPVHVVITLRPLTKIVPSQWQQFVQNGLRKDYDTWLSDVFNDADDRSRTATFWRRHDHGRLASRWMDAVGADNVTVIVVDGSDRDVLTRTFEQMAGLRPGSIVAPTASANRSLTVAEIELVRRVNLQIGDEAWAKEAYAKVMKDGVSDAMQISRRPGPEEVAITTPRWALERAAAIGAESAKTIESLGVRIVGDIERIGDLPGDDAVRPEGFTMPAAIPLEAAILAVIGAVHGMEKARPLRTPLAKAPDRLEDASGRDLLRALGKRGAKRARNKLGR